MDDIYLTQEQLDKLREEYDFYLKVKRPEIVQRIKEAKSFGDLSENSEYDSAREEQSFVEAKIKELDVIVHNAKIIDKVENSDIVVLGSIVTYEDMDLKKKYKYKIVGVGANPLDEDDPSISSNTNTARAILGKKVKEEVEFDVPNGTKRVRIIKIN